MKIVVVSMGHVLGSQPCRVVSLLSNANMRAGLKRLRTKGSGGLTCRDEMKQNELPVHVNGKGEKIIQEADTTRIFCGYPNFGEVI